MEKATVGKVIVAAKLENVLDLYEASQGRLADSQVRRVNVSDARVDTGATLLGMPRPLIDALGLPQIRTGRAQTTAGVSTFGIFGPVRLTIEDRACSIDVSEVAAGCPVLIGSIPLELLDFVVDPRAEVLIGNPAHGGDFILDMF